MVSVAVATPQEVRQQRQCASTGYPIDREAELRSENAGRDMQTLIQGCNDLVNVARERRTPCRPIVMRRGDTRSVEHINR